MRLAAVHRSMEIRESTYTRWKSQYIGMKSNEAVRLKKRENENRRRSVSLRNSFGYLDAHGPKRSKLLSPGRKRAAVELLRNLRASPNAVLAVNWNNRVEVTDGMWDVKTRMLSNRKCMPTRIQANAKANLKASLGTVCSNTTRIDTTRPFSLLASKTCTGSDSSNAAKPSRIFSICLGMSGFCCRWPHSWD
jgi:hypothetical protein